MNLDIIPNGAIKRVHVSQNDVGRTLTFELFNNSTSYTVPSGATVKIQGTKPSGFGFSEPCTVNGNVATIDTTEAMTDESGNIQTELSISYGDVVIGTSNFVLAVEKNPHPDTTTDGSMDKIIPELTLLVNEVKGYAEEIEGTYHAYGSPWVASTVAEMTDTDKIYVYIGSESGYTNGNWYYYNGSSWVSGGVYNAVAVQTDTTLSVSDMPADAKVVGDFRDAFDETSIIEKFRRTQTINKGLDGITFLLVTRTGNTTITNNQLIYAEHDLVLNVKSGYMYIVATFSSSNWTTENHIANTAWQTGEYSIPKGTYFTVQIMKTNRTAFDNGEEDKNVVTISELAYKEDLTPLINRVATLEEKPTLYHILGTGQSLAVGAEGNPALTTVTPYEYVGKAYQFNGGSRPIDGMDNDTGVEEISILDKCLDCFSSLREETHILDLGSGEDQRHAYQGETISSSCGYTFAKLTGQMCLVSQHGFGGKSYANLKKGTTAYNNAIRAVYHAKDLCDRLGWNYIVLAITVVHGEADLAGGTSATTYKNDLIEWLNDFDTDCKAITGQTQDLKLYVSQTCAQSAYGLSGNPIATGVLDACRANNNIRFVCPQYGYLFTYTSIHMDNYGYRYLGEYFGQQIGRDFNGSDVNTVYPIAINRNGTTITVDFNHLTNLTLDTSNVLQTSDGHYGFRLYDPANNAQIQSVTLSNNQIIIQTDVTAGYYSHLQYAYAPTSDEMGFIGNQKGVRGCLRDSSGITSMFDNQKYLVNWCAEFDIVVTAGAL